MRRKIPDETKRNKLIGVKVQETTRKQLEYIAERDQTTLSTLINNILVAHIKTYFSIAKIDWEEESKAENI